MNHVFARLALLVTVASSTAAIAAACSGAAESAAPAHKTILVGAWVKPRQPGPATIADLEHAVGRPLDFSMHYHRMNLPFPTPEEADDKPRGRTPIVSLGCARPADVAAGADDAAISALATSMAAYGKTIELRYCWEMNGGYRHIEASDFVAAWRRIHDAFAQAGVKNVRWYFCPGAEYGRTGRSGLAYYPGDAYVDDIGVDIYDRRGEGFQAMLQEAYHAYDGINKPFIIGETGALGTADQATFLTASTATLLRTSFPKVAGIVYFDAAGPHGDWSFTPAGLASFAAFAKAAR
jgi:endoglucanase